MSDRKGCLVWAVGIILAIWIGGGLVGLIDMGWRHLHQAYEEGSN